MKLRLVALIGLTFLLGACAVASDLGQPSGSSPESTIGIAPGAPSNDRALSLPGEAFSKEGALASQAPSADGGAGLGQTESGNLLDRKLVQNADLTLEVKDPQDSVQAAKDIAQSLGGFVASSSLRFEGEHRVGVITIRVPAARFEDAMKQLRLLALPDGIKADNSGVRDVTEEYTDLGARLRSLQATESQYLELLKSARTIQEILTVQDRLNQVRTQIEQAQGRIQVLERLSDLATINVRLTPPLLGSVPDGWSPLQVLQQAWQSASETLQVMASVGIYALVFVWIWGPLLALGLWLRGRTRTATPAPPSVNV